MSRQQERRRRASELLHAEADIFGEGARVWLLRSRPRDDSLVELGIRTPWK
jgi:hypothetical protein